MGRRFTHSMFAAMGNLPTMQTKKVTHKPRKQRKRMDNTPTMAPPLDVDLNTVKTDLPLLADGIYELQFTKVELKQTAAQQDMLHFELSTAAPATALTGEALGPGIRVFDNLNLAPSGAATWDMVVRNMGSVVQCVGLQVQGATLPEQIAWLKSSGPSLLQGQVARVKVGNEPAGVNPKNGKSFKAKNTVQWLPKGK